MSIPGIPDGYDAMEQESLRVGTWRFYIIAEREDSSSIHEANWPVRAGQGKPGSAGLAEFLDDPAVKEQLGSAEPARVAAQVAMFLIEGDSRQSVLFRVIEDPAQDAAGFEAYANELHPPELRMDDQQVTVRAWLMRDGYLRRMVVTHAAGTPPAVDLSTTRTR